MFYYIAAYRYGVRAISHYVRNVVRSGVFCICNTLGYAFFVLLVIVLVCWSISLEMLLDLLLSVFAILIVVRISIMLSVVMVCGPDRNVVSSTGFSGCSFVGGAFYALTTNRGGVQPC